jgi:transposase-like protein
MPTTRRHHSREFKAEVAVTAVGRERTIDEFAAEHYVLKCAPA